LQADPKLVAAPVGSKKYYFLAQRAKNMIISMRQNCSVIIVLKSALLAGQITTVQLQHLINTFSAKNAYASKTGKNLQLQFRRLGQDWFTGVWDMCFPAKSHFR
jgi:hypothetical protein